MLDGQAFSCLVETMRRMIVVSEEETRFNYRVVGVALHAGRVLVHRAVQDNFWALPGGRVELFEFASQALIREMREELGIAVQVERLLWVNENFFGDRGIRNHELGLYFLMSIPVDSPILKMESFPGQEGETHLIFQWFPLDVLDRLPLYPTFLRERLRSLPSGIEHIEHRDDSYLVVS